MARKTKNSKTISRSSYRVVDSPRELTLGGTFFINYGSGYHEIVIRNRVTRENYPEFKPFNWPNGHFREETIEQYKEYRHFLIDRVNNKQIFKKDDTIYTV